MERCCKYNLEKVKRALAHSETTYDSTEDFFESIGINQALFEKAYKQCSKKENGCPKKKSKRRLGEPV